MSDKNKKEDDSIDAALDNYKTKSLAGWPTARIHKNY